MTLTHISLGIKRFLPFSEPCFFLLLYPTRSLAEGGESDLQHVREESEERRRSSACQRRESLSRVHGIMRSRCCQSNPDLIVLNVELVTDYKTTSTQSLNINRLYIMRLKSVKSFLSGLFYFDAHF